jgi:hypothetical protein
MKYHNIVSTSPCARQQLSRHVQYIQYTPPRAPQLSHLSALPTPDLVANCPSLQSHIAPSHHQRNPLFYGHCPFNRRQSPRKRSRWYRVVSITRISIISRLSSASSLVRPAPLQPSEDPVPPCPPDVSIQIPSHMPRQPCLAPTSTMQFLMCRQHI